jgi:hypothetical protein
MEVGGAILVVIVASAAVIVPIWVVCTIGEKFCEMMKRREDARIQRKLDTSPSARDAAVQFGLAQERLKREFEF